MATCSKKILVLGWAPPDEEDVDDKVVVDGDLLQEDLRRSIKNKLQYILFLCATNNIRQALHNRVLSSAGGGLQQGAQCGWT